MKLPVKRAPWFSVYNWQVASCELWRCFTERIYREKDNQFDENTSIRQIQSRVSLKWESCNDIDVW